MRSLDKLEMGNYIIFLISEELRDSMIIFFKISKSYLTILTIVSIFYKFHSKLI